MVICLEQGADLHITQLMPLPLTVSCFSKIQIGFAFLVPAHPGSPGKGAIKRVCVCVCVYHILCGLCNMSHVVLSICCWPDLSSKSASAALALLSVDGTDRRTLNHFMILTVYCVYTVYCLQCFDTVGWATGRASSL